MASTGSVEPLLFSLNINAPPEPEAAPAPAHETAAPTTAADQPPSSEAEPLQELSTMFPDVDKEIIEAVMQATPSIEEAVQRLLDMSSTESAPPDTAELAASGHGAADMPLSAEDAAAIASASLDADEELAMALFHEFAESLENVPEEVRREPERYDAYVRAQLEAQLEAEQEQRADAPIGQQASEVLAKIKQSSTSFFERIGLSGKQNQRPGTSGWGKRNEYNAPLISSMDVADGDATSSTRGANLSYAPPQTVASPLMLSRPPVPDSSS